jgi:lauroyl/myristoyl acyltransferase
LSSRGARLELEGALAGIGVRQLPKSLASEHSRYIRHVWAADMGTLLLHLGSEKFHDRALSVGNRQALDDALSDGHGAIIAGLHIGPHLALPLALAQLGYELGVIGAPDVLTLGQRFGEACLPDATKRITWLPTGDAASLVEGHALLRRGKLVLGYVDQIVPRGAKTEEVRLLGTTISTSIVIPKLAALARSRIVPAYMTSLGRARYALSFEEALPPPARDRQSIAATLQSLFNVAEARTLERPEQWLGWQTLAGAIETPALSPRAQRPTLQPAT